MSFKLKTALGLAFIQGSLLMLLLYVSFTELNRTAQSGVSEKANTATQLLATLAKDGVLSYDIATLESYTKGIITQEGILYVKILDYNGNILAEQGSPNLLNKKFEPDSNLSSVDDNVYDSVAKIVQGENYHGRVELGFNTDIISRDAEDTRNRLIILSFVTLILTIGFALILGRYLTKQLNALIAGTEALSSGQLDYRINIKSNDELGVTAAAFNRMAGQLKTLYTNLDKEVSLNQAMFMTSPNAIVVIDSKGVISNYNRAAEKLFGYLTEEITGQNVSILMEEKDALTHNVFLQNYTKTKSSKVIEKSRELTAMHKDGKVIPVDITIGEMVVEDESKFVGVIRDITEINESKLALFEHQKNLEAIVAQRTQQLENAKNSAVAGARAKSEFIANMSHEIRTPMNSIIGFSELLMFDESICAESRLQVQTILNSSKSLLTIINDVLDMSKLESGKFSLESVCFHLPNAVKDALKLVEIQAAEKNIEITLDIDSEVKDRYSGDATRLRQVILNLVGNSIKFTEQGTIEISIYPEKNGDHLTFSVKDSGIGMTKTHYNKIFEAFAQADASTTRRYGGTGLGTTISKQLVELMNGKIWVESEEGKGSTFYFTVDLDEADESSECLYAHVDSHKEDVNSPRAFKILLAEDIEENATLVMLRLKRLGHELKWVKNGNDAVNAYKEDEYDLILMDVMMPKMDGLEATRIIRSIEENSKSHITILALTASVMAEDHERCKASGMDAIEAKPINFRRLVELMEKMVPVSIGKSNAHQYIDIKSSDKIDFGPMVPFVSISKALNTWKDDYQYAKSLKSFAINHGGDAKKLKELLSRSKNTEAKVLMHTLTGVAGNLFLKGIATLSSGIDTLIQDNNENLTTKITSDLHRVIDNTVKAITEVNLSRDSNPIKLATAEEPAVTNKLMDSMVLAINDYNPDSVEPILAELRKYFSEPRLRQLSKAVDNFDFDEALSALTQLRSIEVSDNSKI
jgi:PAS domain S-box-containing protein